MFIYQSQVEAKVYEIAKPMLDPMGYKIVRIRFKGGAHHKTLQLMLDRTDGKMLTLEDCEKVSSYLSVLLDAQDVISIRYTLEASSPGLNRPLTTYEDFVNYNGKEIKLLLKLMVQGRRNIIGKLVEVDE